MADKLVELRPQDKLKIERFLTKIKNDIYPEPRYLIHDQLTRQGIDDLLEKYPLDQSATILDVGCGQGPALEVFTEYGYQPTGITLGEEDVNTCKQKGFDVHEMDQSFLDFDDHSFDCLWCRHCLEHSIFPYFTLFEWHRVLKSGGLIYIELPAPETTFHHEFNANHYSVLGASAWSDLIQRSGFDLLEATAFSFALNDQGSTDTYYKFIARKK